MGLGNVPEAGSLFHVVSNEKEARAIVEERSLERKLATEPSKAYSLDDIFERFQAGETQALNLIIKADVQGSLEPIVNSLENISYGKLKVKILRADTGNISESDVMLASASDAIVIGFGVKPDSAARNVAEVQGISVRSYELIYKLVEDVDKALKGMMEPEYAPVVIGKAEVRAVFRIRRVGEIAGCMILEGEARRNAQAHLLRAGEIIHDGAVSSLKRFEEDVRQVRAGFECGVGLEGMKGYREGDIIVFYVVERVN
jgi:translation initiation factor IF-2